MHTLPLRHTGLARPGAGQAALRTRDHRPCCGRAQPGMMLLGAHRPERHLMTVLTQPKPTGAPEPPFAPAAAQASIELYWLPLGAGGWLVRLNGRIYEAIHALLERRRPLDLYHSALVVRLPEGRFVIEDAWPIPDADGPSSRGVLVEGPVGSPRMARWRGFPSEVRRWRR